MLEGGQTDYHAVVLFCNLVDRIGIINLERRQNFRKKQYLLTSDSRRTCAYQSVRKESFSKNFA